MMEYEELGLMEYADEDITKKPQTCYYIPHNAVQNENNTTTKLRVVLRRAQASV